jgi:hypothetical protein
MVSLLERTISGVDRRLVLLAPPGAPVPPTLRAFNDPVGHQQLLHGLQQLRGRVYLADGALTRDQLLSDGRHRTPEDEYSWHLLTVGADGRPNACAWYRRHHGAIGLEHLRLRRCPLAADTQWQDGFKKAVEAEIARARRERLHYAELGGWAVSPANRRSPDVVVLALAVFALSRLLGGALGITTATVRHRSSTILRRLGGVPLQVNGAAAPLYHDPTYQGDMELLSFDSRRPDARYAEAINRVFDRMAQISVLANSASTSEPVAQNFAGTLSVRDAVAAA